MEQNYQFYILNKNIFFNYKNNYAIFEIICELSFVFRTISIFNINNKLIL